jgi:hypothetical protein
MFDPDLIFQPYYTFQVFTPKECQQIIDDAEAIGFDVPMFTDAEGNTGHHPSRSVMLREGELFDLVAGRLKAEAPRINQYEYTLFDDPVRQIFIIRYDEGALLYEHVDYIGLKGCHTRKLNTTTALNDGFEGGHLTLSDCGYRPLAGVAVGTTAVYPGYAAHSVTQVTKGVRYSLAAWMHGPCYK